jgi:mannose-6-phosphate isomerase-like protein (cupin superfamily)
VKECGVAEKSDADIWRAFDLEREIAAQRSSGRPYREFLRVPALSCGVYSLAAGAKDLQAPHDEDEVYLVVSGRGRVRIDGRERPVGRGTILYVGATSEHSFFEIEEDITLLVFFGSGGPG